jgi:hypothetical protein
MNELKPEDVMKALECCLDFECTECPMNYEDCEEREFEYLVRQSLPMLKALLREKDAEIERLRDLLKETAEYNEAWVKDNGDLRKALKTARADAITEFAERLKQCTECMGECTVDNPLAETYSVVREEYIDQITKEMKEENES